MAARTNATTTRAGVLRSREFACHARLVRTETTPALEPFVEYHWTLSWELPDDVVYPSAVVPHPAANLTVEHGIEREGAGGAAVVTGVITRRFDVDLAGIGWVHGAKLRPGALVVMTGVDAASLVDATVPARAVVTEEVATGLESIGAGAAPSVATELVCRALMPLVPEQVPADYERLLAIIEGMLDDRTLTRVEQVAERHGLSRRSLERLFARLVGVGPKWVLARHRLHDVVTALDDGYIGSLSDLAAEHGWYDQAHFGRDFTALVGVTPSEYRAQIERERSSSAVVEG